MDFVSSVYRKLTFSNQYHKFNFVNPLSYKLTVIRTLFHRDKFYCIKDDLLGIELNRSFSDLKINGYPLRLIKSIYNEMFFPSTKVNPYSDKSLKQFISISYYKGISESIVNFLKSVNVFTAFKPQSRMKKFFSNFKSRVSLLDRIGLFCSIPCKNCDSVCVVEIGRIGIIKIKEYKRPLKAGSLWSKLVYHALETDHVPNFELAKVLASGVSLYELRTFLKEVYTKLQPAPLNEAMTVPAEYTIFFIDI